MQSMIVKAYSLEAIVGFNRLCTRSANLLSVRFLALEEIWRTNALATTTTAALLLCRDAIHDSKSLLTSSDRWIQSTLYPECELAFCAVFGSGRTLEDECPSNHDDSSLAIV